MIFGLLTIDSYSFDIIHYVSFLRDFSKLREEQERLRRRQAELERMRRAAEEKRAQAEREEEERRRRHQEELLAARHRLELEEEAATKIQASYRGFRERQALKERRRR